MIPDLPVAVAASALVALVTSLAGFHNYPVVAVLCVIVTAATRGGYLLGRRDATH